MCLKKILKEVIRAKRKCHQIVIPVDIKTTNKDNYIELHSNYKRQYIYFFSFLVLIDLKNNTNKKYL